MRIPHTLNDEALAKLVDGFRRHPRLFWKFNGVELHPQQEKVFMLAAQRKKVLFYGCNKGGKDYVASLFMLWNWCTRPSINRYYQPTYGQTALITWEYIQHFWSRRRPFYDLLGRILETAQVKPLADGPRMHYIKGMTQEQKEATMSGFHGVDGCLVVSEVQHLSMSKFEMLSTTWNDTTSVIFVGNPIGPCPVIRRLLTEDGWEKVRVDGEEVAKWHEGRGGRLGLVDEAWIQEQEQRHGRDSVFFRQRVRGEVTAAESVDCYVRLHEYDAACAAYRGRPDRVLYWIWGLDVGEHGTSRSVLTVRVVGELDGKPVDCIWRQVAVEDRDPHELVAWACDELRALGVGADGAEVLGVVDAVGVGAGVATAMTEAGFRADGIKWGGKPVPLAGVSDPDFAMLRDQLKWRLGARLKRGELSINRNGVMPELREELTAEWTEERSGKVVRFCPKERVIEQIGRSPDASDSVQLTEFAMLYRRDWQAFVGDQGSAPAAPSVVRVGKEEHELIDVV